MRRRIHKLRHAIKKAGGVDILVTHSPARGLGDRDDPAHRGFECLRELLGELKPEIMLHGHVHPQYDFSLVRELSYEATRIINVSDRYVLDLTDRSYPEKEEKRIIWKTKHKVADFESW